MKRKESYRESGEKALGERLQEERSSLQYFYIKRKRYGNAEKVDRISYKRINDI